MLVVIAIISVWDDVSVRTGNPGHITALLSGVILGTILSASASVRRHTDSVLALAALVLVASAVAARWRNPVAPPLYAAARAFDAGQKEKALTEIDLALKIAPDDMAANKIASEIFLNEPDYPRAEKAIRRVLAVAKDDDYSLYLLGIVQLRTNRCDQAIEIGKQLTSQNSKYAHILSESPCYIFPKDARTQ